MPVKKNKPEELSTETITEHDILFDCTECKRPLVIDERAASLKISCPACGGEIEVPQQSHTTRSLEHHDDATVEEKLALLERQMSENKMQHAEATNKLNDCMTQANRCKVRIQKLERDYRKMEEQLKGLSKKKT